MTLVITLIVSESASRYMRPDLAMLTVVHIVVTMAVSFLVLIAVPCVALLARSVKMLPEIRRAIDGRGMLWAQRLIELARRSPRPGGENSAWNVEVDCLEGAFLYQQGDYEECLALVAPVFKWASAAGDVALARESGYFYWRRSRRWSGTMMC